MAHGGGAAHGSNQHEPDWDDNGKKYLEKYGLTGNAITSLNLCAQGLCVGAVGATDIAKGLVENWSLVALQLKRQEIGREGAVGLGQALKQNRYLRQLGLAGNRLGPAGCISLMDGLRHNQTVEFLDLSMNELRDEGAVAIGQMLKYNNSLQVLLIERNRIKAAGSVPIAAALQQNETLRHLNMANNKIGDSGASAIALALKENSSLQSLNLCGCELRQEGITAVARVLAENAVLRSLNLQNNRVAEAATDLGQMLITNSRLRELNLQNTLIDSSAGEALSIGLRSHKPPFAALNLARNPLGNVGARQILSAVCGQPELNYLDMCETGIVGLEVMELLCSVVEVGSGLHVLLLNDNRIGAAGMQLLATRLERAVRLHTLFLDRTQLGPEGATHLAIALGRHTWRAISVSANRLGDDGCLALCKALVGLHTLEEIDLSENDISEACESVLWDVCSANPKLRFMYLHGNPVGLRYANGTITLASAAAARANAEEEKQAAHQAALRRTSHTQSRRHSQAHARQRPASALKRVTFTDDEEAEADAEAPPIVTHDPVVAAAAAAAPVTLGDALTATFAPMRRRSSMFLPSELPTYNPMVAYLLRDSDAGQASANSSAANSRPTSAEAPRSGSILQTLLRRQSRSAPESRRDSTSTADESHAGSAEPHDSGEASPRRASALVEHLRRRRSSANPPALPAADTLAAEREREREQRDMGPRPMAPEFEQHPVLYKPLVYRGIMPPPCWNAAGPIVAGKFHAASSNDAAQHTLR
eukprot:TRINITY_DN21880_c0_g1_i2.p1 TRINITY_DN21880_c0_g1~~TRINITY_DN21880_c0_g1_i2.p1  ORF type:complete len:765 (+),score=102.36 TRINITY_DN21880_c0_g1_i2:46-2340(+)